MITGAHMILYSTDPDADRAFLRDVLRFPHVDAGRGWLIFALPPSEVAIHPTEAGEAESHELYLTCDDLTATLRQLEAAGVACEPVSEQRWGSLTRIVL